MKKIYLIAVFLWTILPVFSQDHSTCDDAIPVHTSSYGPIIAEGWADPSLCVPNTEFMYFGKTHKVVWFSFIVPYDTMLTFQVIPETATDDFDFMLFKADGADFCQKEKKRIVKPIRTNFAKPTEYNKGITGLSEQATENMVGPGYNVCYSSALSVKKGECYYLVVDNYISDQGGFTLKLSFRFNGSTTGNKSSVNANPTISTTTPISKNTAPIASVVSNAPVATPSISNNEPVKTSSATPSFNYIIHVLDSTNHAIKASIFFDGVEPGKLLKVDSTDYALKLKKYQTIKIRVNAPGHMPYASNYSTAGNDSSVSINWAHLQPISSKQDITLNDIQFQQDSPNILTASKPSLDYVLTFLTTNPKVEITIKGFVNDPDHSQSKDYDQALSEARSNSVKYYLTSHGVNKKRIDCKGFGSARMIYPHPKNEEEQVANRRVEIEIK